MMPLPRILLASLFLASSFTGALAHTTLRASTPASGDVLTESPAEVTLEFIEPASMTSLILATAQGERRLAFTPTGSALTFKSPKPSFALGRNELRWRALSRDGHVIEGSIIIVLRAPAR
jgi:methionine-rich copper-binding protein CopC